MPYPDHLLSRGETVVLHKHPHWKVLALPVLWLVLVIGAASFGLALLNSRSDDPGVWPLVITAAALLLIVFLVVVPFAKWRTEHFVLTDRHVFFRAGFFKRREHQIPLGRIQNLEINVSFWGRILGYGTLTVESAADQPLSFYNVASLPRVQGQLNQLIDDDRTGVSSSGGLGGRRDRRSEDDDRGYDPGPGYDQRYAQGYDQRSDQGYDRGYGQGPDQGYDGRGYDQGRGYGVAPGYGRQPSPGPGYDGRGYDQGRGPSYGPTDHHAAEDTSTRRIPQMRDQQGPRYDA
ncbi:PH domain-containing protein [Nakamurella deserti]|uniref:PH domain-containing protein n=1 Tax=Nakamurella deserti TaxID=2164074 RepID=UPI000DBE1350|nr:PH domain-containing protein [Nakamurella deserti]